MKNTAFIKRMIVWTVLFFLGVIIFKLDAISILYGYIIATINWVFVH